jgi:hypothetical protein
VHAKLERMAKPDRKELDALVAIAKLVCPSASRQIVMDVKKAFERPEFYALMHADEMIERGLGSRRADGGYTIDSPGPELPLIALLDGLFAARACFEIDYRKANAPVIGHVIGGLRGVAPDEMAWMMTDDALREISPPELLELAGRHLERRGLLLASIDLDGSGMLGLIVVPIARAARLAELRRHLRYGCLSIYAGAPAAATPARVKAPRRRARAGTAAPAAPGRGRSARRK